MMLFMTRKKLGEIIRNRAHAAIRAEELCKKYEEELWKLYDSEWGFELMPCMRDIMGVPFLDQSKAYCNQRERMRNRRLVDRAKESKG